MKDQFAAASTIFRRHGGILRMSEASRQGISKRTLYAMRDSGAGACIGLPPCLDWKRRTW